jgi:riboflavin kinase/FMN adenylyltransferase
MKQKKIYALGFFDGVHLGHQALLQECVARAEEKGCIPAAITFDRHPQSLFTPTPPALINSNADRDALLHRYGVESIHRLAVKKDIMSTSWRNFLENLLEEGAAGFVCGDDFRFGHKGEGSAEKLQMFCRERQLPCIIVPEQVLEGIRISSTHIRSLIESGDMETAAKFLSHPHILSGEVVPGRQLGRTIGVPTANILIPDGVVTPKLGVYACACVMGGKTYSAVTNIGSRPTVGGHQVRAESWILDFDGDLYGKTITLEFHKFLRPEKKFDSLEELQTQIQKDAAEAGKILKKV